MNALASAAGRLIRREASAGDASEGAPPLPAALEEVGALRQWALVDAGKVAVRFDGRRTWGRDGERGDVAAVLAALRAGKVPPRRVLGTYAEACEALSRLHGRAVPQRDWATGDVVDGPAIDGISLRFLPVSGRRLVGVDFDGVIDEAGRLHAACAELLGELDTFVEVSVSGRGLHAYCWAEVDEAAPEQAVAYLLGDGGPSFVPVAGKAASCAIYDGRSWRHFRWGGVGYGRWAHHAVAERTATVRRWQLDIEACRKVDAWRAALEAPAAPAVRPRGRAVGGDWARVLTVGQVAERVGARPMGSRYRGFCPHCRAIGRKSRSGSPTLSLWDAGGRVAVHCFYCETHGMSRDVFRAVASVVAAGPRR